ncbi:MAG: type VI secretion system tip protein VgrG [Gammaproteobacteria bacterium]|nr:type VI secretion system tip protein VgrG [Gammaproteobacteria bacterium]
MGEFNGNTALLTFEIKGEAASFRVVQCHGKEANSALYEYTVHLVCKNTERRILVANVLARSATLTVLDEQGDTARYVHGAVVSFTQGEESDRWTHYTLILRPQAWRLTLRQDCRIFQQQAVPDIIKAVLLGAGLPTDNYRFALYLSYEPRNYCVQYQETDLDFIERLMREEGIFYFFEHHADQHVMVFSDAYQIHVDIQSPAEIRYQHPTGLVPEEDSVYPFTHTQLIQTGQVSLQDFNFEKPALSLQTNQQHDIDQDLEVYDYPGRYPLPESGSRYASVRLEALQVRRNLTCGSTDCRRFMAGHRFTLDQHPYPDMNQRYVLTSVKISAKQPQVLDEEAGNDCCHYQVDFECIPAETPFRAADDPSKPKPMITGVQTAIVVGPAGEEIYVDEHGRVKVQFHWDRNGQNNDRSSCWIRVSQLWAGEQWGAMFIPRIGQEVIVDFVDGDPDRPIITGRVYHGINMPPYNLPAEKTKSTIKTRSSPGGTAENFNELRFEDKKGEEEIYIHAEKNQKNVVKNNETTRVGYNRRENVGHNETIAIGNNRTETVEADETITIGGNQTELIKCNKAETIAIAKALSIGAGYQVSVGAAMNETVAGAKMEEVGAYRMEVVAAYKETTVGEDFTVTVDNKYALEGKKEITIKSGASSVSMKEDGKIEISGTDVTFKTAAGKIHIDAGGIITIKGAMVKINT